MGAPRDDLLSVRQSALYQNPSSGPIAAEANASAASVKPRSGGRSQSRSSLTSLCLRRRTRGPLRPLRLRAQNKTPGSSAGRRPVRVAVAAAFAGIPSFAKYQ